MGSWEEELMEYGYEADDHFEPNDDDDYGPDYDEDYDGIYPPEGEVIDEYTSYDVIHRESMYDNVWYYYDSFDSMDDRDEFIQSRRDPVNWDIEDATYQQIADGYGGYYPHRL